MITRPAFLLGSKPAAAGGGSPSYVYAEGFSATEPDGTAYAHPVNDIRLAKITFASGGTVDFIGIMTEFINAATNVKLGIFDNSGTPAIVGSSVILALSASGSHDNKWVDQAASITIPSAGTYWIGMISDDAFEGAVNGRYKAGSSGTTKHSTDGTYAGFPGALGTLSDESNAIGLRCRFTPA